MTTPAYTSPTNYHRHSFRTSGIGIGLARPPIRCATVWNGTWTPPYHRLHRSKPCGSESTKWFLCMLTFTLECYGWVALALPVYANVSWDPERPLNKPAHTGRASATQPEA